MKIPKIAHFLFIFVFSLLFSSCALNYYYTYQPSAIGTGKAVFKPASPTEKTFVLLNDSLIIDNKFVKSITFENLPEGKYELHYMSSNFAYKDKLDQRIIFDIQQGKLVKQIITLPPFSTGYWIFNGIALAGLLTYELLLYNQ
jgi:hypothetical protein